MPPEKTTTMTEAIDRIAPGESVAMGLALEHAIPFAAGHELLRQKPEDLTLIGPISDTLFDQLIGGGIVSRVRAAWVGNVSAGTGHRFREAANTGTIDVEDHSNFSMALALHAASLGVPYLPTRSLLGSDIFTDSDLFKASEDPFTGESLALVPAIHPDWAIIHVQRTDPTGNAHFWGNTGVMEPAIGAADRVIVTAEEIVDPEVITSDPSRVILTRDQVAAVVECPYGAHPSPLAGYYRRDHHAFLDYYEQSDTQAGYAGWRENWVTGMGDREDYIDRIEPDLEVQVPTVAAEARYGQ